MTDKQLIPDKSDNSASLKKKLAAVRKMRRVQGVDAARRLWGELDLPNVFK